MNTVRDFYFTFAQTNWWTLLQNSRSTGVDIQANLTVDNVTYNNVGIRMRSSSSSQVAGNKMPFNVTMDAFVPLPASGHGTRTN